MRRTLIACVVVALLVGGGTATASGLITGSDIKNGSVTGKDIKQGSLTASDLAQSVRRKLNTTVSASPGAPGPQGPQGPAGATGISEIVSTQANDTGMAMAVCPAGTRPVSGGGVEEGSGYLWANGAARDLSTGQSGWLVAGDAASPVTAFAYCSAGVSRFTFPDGTSAMMSVSKIKAAAARRAAR